MIFQGRYTNKWKAAEKRDKAGARRLFNGELERDRIALVAGEHRGSIHKVGAALQNAPSCNGWTFWHFERAGALVPLDVLRTEAPPTP